MSAGLEELYDDGDGCLWPLVEFLIVAVVIALVFLFCGWEAK